MRDQDGLNDIKAPLDGRGSVSSKKEKKKVRGKKKGKGAEKEVKQNIKISERYNEEDADITIISSDGTAFKVHSFLLLRASPVFKSMVGIAQSDAQRDPINLTDKRIEHSLVVEATLDILYNHEIVSFANDMAYCCVVDFARKWDMAIVLKTISMQLRLHCITPQNGNRPLGLLRIAIALGETEPITTIIRYSCGKTWPAASGRGEKQQGDHLPYKPPSLPKPTLSDSTSGFLKGAPIFDLGGWPYAKFADLPTPLVWALLRAGTTLD